MENVLIDEFMKGKAVWGESPIHVWENEVKPQLHKLEALHTLIDHGMGEIISAGWHGDFGNNVTRGICQIIDDVQYVLDGFEKKLPEKVENLLRKNLEKAAREAERAIEKKEPVSDPKTIASYKNSIETLLANMAPEKREHIVSELKGNEKLTVEDKNIEFALTIGQSLSADKRAKLIEKLAEVEAA